MVDVKEAKAHFSRLLASLEKDGQTIVICRNGKSVVDLVPHQRVSRTHIHPVLSRIKVNYDPTESLTDDEWPRR